MKKIFLKWQRQTRKLGFLAAMMAVSMVAFMMLSFPLNAQIPKSTELRGVWLTNIDSDVLFESNRLKQSLRTLHQLNFNTVYPAVWNWGYTLYPSKVAAKVIGKSVDPTPGLQKRDMLKEIVTEGHKQGLTVIPWFEFGFMAPADSLLAKNRPAWLTNRRDGTKIVKEGTHNRVWLNP
ncbi:MAG: glycoside hydrolase family 10 protein, partial [Sphaerospermopsis kisseleviana]